MFKSNTKKVQSGQDIRSKMKNPEPVPQLKLVSTILLVSVEIAAQVSDIPKELGQ